MRHWYTWLIIGIISLVGGFLAFANLFAASLTVGFLTGWAFVMVGVATIASAWADQSTGSRLMAVLLGLSLTLIGVSLIGNPLAGIASLTIVVGVMLLATGVFRILLALDTHVSQLRWTMILSGALSLLLGGMIFWDFPWAAMSVLGIFLAVELTSNGVAMIMLALARRALHAGR